MSPKVEVSEMPSKVKISKSSIVSLIVGTVVLPMNKTKQDSNEYLVKHTIAQV